MQFKAGLRALAALLLVASSAAADVRLPRILSDGVVLQRERRVSIFGFADPLEKVSVRASWGAQSDEALTDQDGTWRTTIVTPAAGGPFTLEVRGRNTLTVRDVMVGEVWLCSGQSNMEMPVAPVGTGYSGVLDWQREVAQAQFPAIRMFTVANDVATAPRDDVTGTWNAVTPATAGGMSATAYFFGRKLHQDLGVPVGLIDATWGGTPAESWTSGITLARFPEYTAIMTDLDRRGRDARAAALERQRLLDGWLAAIEESDHGVRAGFASTAFDDSAWGTANVPGSFAGPLSNHDGVVWMRRTIELPQRLAGRDLQLETGPIDDFDVTWFDGVAIGAGTDADSFHKPRAYVVPARLATAGRHVIAVRVLDTGGAGGFAGAPGAARLHAGDDTLALDGAWRVQAGATLARIASRPSDLEVGAHTPSALYNAMIAPLTRFGIRGVIWYQGESNRSRAFQYKTLFPALIADWRARFSDADLPFYYVQIAPFGYDGDKGESAELREAQRLAMRVPHTGMVVTTDIGDEHDIHPKNKQEVGRRLALWALSQTYGVDVDLKSLPASPLRADELPWITARARTQIRWNRSGDILTLAAPILSAIEGVPLGNGLLGALVWGDEKSLKLTLDRADVWDLRQPDVTRRADWNWSTLQRLVAARDEKGIHALFDEPWDKSPTPTKLPLGRLELSLEGGGGPLEFGLDLAKGEARVVLTGGAVRAFASAALPVVMLRLENRKPQVDWSAEHVFQMPDLSALGFHVAERSAESASDCALRVEGPGGVSFALAAVRNVDETWTDVAITIVQGAEDSDPMTAALERAAAALKPGYAQRLAEHVQAFRNLTVNAARVRIGDPALQTQYDLARYLTVSGSRRGSVPMGLQGVWTSDAGLPAWRGDYHNDLNTQATYCAYATAGLFDSGASFCDHNWKLLPRLREVARTMYGVEGAVLPGCMALDGAPIGAWPQYALSPTNGAWTATIFARQWRVTRDETFLRDRAYPWCSAIGTALLSLLQPPDARGKRKLLLSTSPEIHDNSMAAWLAPNSNYDLAALRALFRDLAEMAHALRLETDAKRWTQALSELDDFGLDDRGALAMAPGEPFAESHRHMSHALAIHPLGLISIEGPANERATTDATLDEILEKGTGAWTGYSFAWFSCLAARAGRPETALRALRDYERAFTLRNGLHANGDQSGEGLSADTSRVFTIEGNMLAMEAVHEMLLQSQGGVVRVFPSTSVTWPDASFEGLRAEGGFVVSARRTAGATAEVHVRATTPGELRLRDPFDVAGVDWNRRDVTRDGRDWIVRLGPGDELIGTRASGR